MINKISFKGYDARPIQGLMTTDKTSADALQKISKDTGIEVYRPNIASKSIKKERFDLSQSNKLIWAQDYITALNHNVKAVLYDGSRDFLKRVLRATADGMEKDFGYKPVKAIPHLRGGNFFICNNNGKRELLLSENKMIYPEELCKTIFNVEKIHTIPKLDYHLDLFIRPLDNGNVLVADNEMTKQAMKQGIVKINQYIETHNPSDKEKKELEDVIEQIDLLLQKLEITEKFSPYKPVETTPKVIEALKNAGYNPIRIPAAYNYLTPVKDKDEEKRRLNNFDQNMKELKRLAHNYEGHVEKIMDKFVELQTFKQKNNPYIGVELEYKYNNNFINAIAAQKDGKIIYITNAPLLDKELKITPEIEQKTGFSTKNMFIESVAPYIDKENIYFIDEKTTERLFNYMGGIHCTAAEIPAI